MDKPPSCGSFSFLSATPGGKDFLCSIAGNAISPNTRNFRISLRSEMKFKEITEYGMEQWIRKKFEAEQQRLAEEYRAAGMTEEQIEEMYQFDLAEFRSRRRFCEHNQQLPRDVLDQSSDDKLPLYEKFLGRLSVDIELSDSGDRYWWVEEIDDQELARKIKKLSHDEIELITLYAFEHYTQVEIAAMFGISQRAISKRLEKIK